MNDERRATISDLHQVEGQAELINGRIVRLPGHGIRVGRVAGRIARSLFDHQEQTGVGEVYTSTLSYSVPMLSSGRESFCSDVSYYTGPFPENPMAFIDGPPTFAVEIRDEADDRLEDVIARGRKVWDYFEAGTKVVWDVDPFAGVIHSFFMSDDVDGVQRIKFTRGQFADAEPAVPGWKIAVDDVFGPIEPA